MSTASVAQSGWLIPLVVAPLFGAFGSMVWSRRAHAIGVASCGLLSGCALVVAAVVLSRGELRVALGGWAEPLAIQLRADGLAAAMIVMSSLISLVLGVCARSYFQDSSLRSFWPLWLMLQVALISLFLSDDAFNIYVTLEVLSLTAVGLVALAKTREATSAAFRYLTVSLVGSMAYLLGVAFLYADIGVLDLGMISQRIQPSSTSGLAAALLTAGLLLKGAIFPLHFWLPPAHGSAPAPVSAALSALVVKAAAYVLFRLWVEVFPTDGFTQALDFTAVLGGVALVWGGIQAVKAERLKLVVAYSTVAQLGYIGLALPMAKLGGVESTGWLGLAMFLLAHGLAKAGLFAGAGAIQREAGNDRVASLAEAAPRIPTAFLAMGVAAVSLMGLPPSGGFAAKWLMIEAAFQQSRWITIAVIGVGTLISGAYLLRILQPAFVIGESQSARSGDPAARHLAAGGLVLALAAIALGLAASPALSLLTSAATTIPGAGP